MKTILLFAGGALIVFAILELAKKQEQIAPSGTVPQPPAPGFNPTV
jgi:hypothetical protein